MYKFSTLTNTSEEETVFFYGNTMYLLCKCLFILQLQYQDVKENLKVHMVSI